MKKICVILFGLMLNACAQPEPDTVFISGTVENPAGQEIEIFYYKDFITNATEVVKAELDENNAFEAEVPMRDAQFVHMRIPRRTITLYLLPGARVDVVFDAEDAGNLPVVSGEKSLESNFLLSYNMDVERKYGMMTVLSKAGEKTPDAFREYVHEIYDEALAYMEDYPGREALDPYFMSLMLANILYEKYGRLMDYPMARTYFSSDAEAPPLPDDYYDFIRQEGVFDDAFAHSRPYFSFLNKYLDYYMEHHVEQEATAENYGRLRFDAAKSIFSGKSLDLVLAQSVISALNFGDFKQGEALYEVFMDLAGDWWPRKVVQAEYEVLLALAPGNPAPGFRLKDIHGEEVSLDDFLGKVVYLDFWASWCGPCMQQVPHARELKQRMAGHDDLVFLYISVDTDEAAWRKTVEEHDIQGVHLNVPGFSHEVPGQYNLKGVPTFYLIGRDGTIIDNRPPRPSHEDIDDVLLAALGVEPLEPVAHTASISGVLENIPEGPVELNFFRDYINNDRKVIALDVNENGAFDLNVEVTGPVMATLTTVRGSVPLFLEPGYALYIKGDALRLGEKILFAGQGGDENNFFVDYRHSVEASFPRALIHEKSRELEPTDFMHFADSVAEVKARFLEKHAFAPLLGGAMQTYFNTQVLVEKYQMLMAYPGLHQRLNQLDALPGLPVDYYAFLDEAINLDGESLRNLDYIGFLLSYMDHKLQTGDRQYGEELSRHEVNYSLAGLHLTGLQKYYMQALSVSREMNSGHMDAAMGMYEDFMEKSPVEEYKESLEAAYENIRALWAGNPAPMFAMTDLEGNEVTLSDYRGKVVYLKFWASWCGPCMREVPPAAELKERMAGRDDLVFMYVSIDTDPEAWRNAVERHGISGVHMRTPGRERGVPALYNVRWIPTFYIIGRDGNIYDHRPPKPSDGGLDEALLEALAAQPA